MSMDRLLRLTSGVMLLVVFFFGLMGSNVSLFWKAFVVFIFTLLAAGDTVPSLLTIVNIV